MFFIKNTSNSVLNQWQDSSANVWGNITASSQRFNWYGSTYAAGSTLPGTSPFNVTGNIAVGGQSAGSGGAILFYSGATGSTFSGAVGPHTTVQGAGTNYNTVLYGTSGNGVELYVNGAISGNPSLLENSSGHAVFTALAAAPTITAASVNINDNTADGTTLALNNTATAGSTINMYMNGTRAQIFGSGGYYANSTDQSAIVAATVASYGVKLFGAGSGSVPGLFVASTGALSLPYYYTTAGLLQNYASGNVTTNGSTNAVPGTAYFTNLTATGNVGIGTSSPDMLLAVGSATSVGNVAHFENSTGSCYINPTTTSLSCSSDARLKYNINSLTATSGVAALMQLNPVTYNWNSEESGTTAHGGFIAQQVLPILPDLVSQGPDGYYTLNYAGFTPYLVKAVQEIASITGAFKDNLVAWLGNASNGIGDLFAKNLYATNVTADTGNFSTGHFSNELCVGNTCVTETQFKAMVAAANQSPASANSSSGGGSATTTPDTTPPTITINGENPAHIKVGDLYADLGATVTDNVDQNHGLKYFLNGALVSDIVIDTSAAATDTIDYVAADNAGNTATSTRTVIVEAQASSFSAASNATTSAATSTSQ